MGTSDWTGGGLLPSALPVPDASLPSYAAELAEARYELSALRPVEPWEPAPVSALWPASGVRSADGHSHDVQPLRGGRWAASRGDPAALELHRIEMLRGQCRAAIHLGPDGQALRAYDPAWRYYDGWLDGSPWAGHWNPWGAQDPRAFRDYGIASYVQRLGECWALVWLANDPVARLLSLEAATRARKTWSLVALPPGLALGSDIGSAEASGALAIAVARALGEAQYEPWVDSFLAHIRQAQMLSGCFVARRGAYPSQHAPFAADDYALQGAQEFALLQLAAYSLGEHDVVRRAAAGMANLATDDDDPGLYYHTVTGRGATDRYLWARSWPPELDAQMGEDNESYYTAWDMGYATSLAFATGAFERAELLRRFTDTADTAQALARMRGWGLVAPDEQTRAPFEQWWALMGQL